MAAPADPHLRRRRRARTFWMLGLPLGTLASVLAAIAAGLARDRLWPVAGFLTAAVTASTYVWASTHQTFRRAYEQQKIDVPWNVRLSKPFWISLGDSCTLLFPGAVLGALAAAVGFPGFGVGALLTFAALASVAPFADFGFKARGLTFEATGLRVHGRGASFVVPWTSITDIDRIGPKHFQMVHLRFREPKAVLDATGPPDPKLRARVETIVQASGPDGLMMFLPWTAGVDGSVLARAIDAARGGTTGKVN